MGEYPTHVVQELTQLADELAARHEPVLAAWRARVRADAAQVTAGSLTRTQLNDHIPAVLVAFERTLRASAGGAEAAAAERAQRAEEIKHGLHRWQQSYDLEEVTREWAHLHHCVFDEFVAFSASRPDLSPETRVAFTRELIAFIHQAVTESTSQYAQMQRKEAAGRFIDLQQTLQEVRELERRRAQLIHQAVHDMRGDVQSVGLTAEMLREGELSDAERGQFITLLQRGTVTVGQMLAQLLELARLEARMEQRAVAAFDAAALIREFVSATDLIARERNLYLHAEGPATLEVQGDATRVRRLLQNLVLNALNYTETGGVTLHWGAEGETSWWLVVKDTGPGLQLGPGSPLVDAMVQATASAHDSDARSSAGAGGETHVVKLPPGDPDESRGPARQQPGEGIGLSIVKRLCELLDASVELVSSAASGTSFRIVLPRRYG